MRDWGQSPVHPVFCSEVTAGWRMAAVKEVLSGYGSRSDVLSAAAPSRKDHQLD